ncbi:hypothetical protein DIY07_01625 [Streptococcus iniae]|uniref:Uncharacterized protein n=2 Tax=Streptococcus iniae TaxID=1346 RepID=A0A3L8GFX1_STRIN|nr:hypothetical protein DIY09_01650 [Streptococcus iniae]RLU58762.1 hypothetical protein DIY07_01625 [Streptococcus iniae]
MEMENKRSTPKVSRSIPERVKSALWSITAGRCEICCKKLYISDVTGNLVNISQMAHIKAFSPNGPRYSEEENNPHQLDNLLLLCAEHHKMIDTDPDDFPVDWLVKQKKKFEEKVDAVIDTQRIKSSILSFNSIVTKDDDIKNEEAEFPKVLLFNDNYFDGNIYRINNTLPGIEHNPMYYNIMCQSMKQQIEKMKIPLYSSETISVFAIAPQPLLLYLGYLLNDETNIKIYQRFRNGNLKWNWESSEVTNHFYVEQLYTDGNEIDTEVNLILSLSAEIYLDRIPTFSNQEDKLPTLILRSDRQGFDAIKSNEDVNEYISVFRNLVVEKIRNDFSNLKCINIFPATPVSVPIRMGMNYQKNIDVEWKIFNQQTNVGFIYSLSLKGEV